MRFRPRSVYDVFATLALFGVLSGGTALAVDGALPGQNTVGSQDIINSEVATADLGENSVGSTKIVDGQVKNQDLGAAAASSNTIADGGVEGVDVKSNTLTGDDINESTLVGLGGSVGPPEDWHEVAPASATEDRCAVESGVFCTRLVLGVLHPWGNSGDGYSPAGFYKDQLGVVHLKGLASFPTGDFFNDEVSVSSILRLPPGYRPANRRVFPTVGEDQIGGVAVAAGRIDVTPDGHVALVRDCVLVESELDDCSARGLDITLEGVKFRPDE